MAEIITTVTRTEKSYPPGDTTVTTTTEARTEVTSIHGGTAHMVRDFAFALEVAKAPDGTHIEPIVDGGLLVGLRAEWRREVAEPLPPTP